MLLVPKASGAGLPAEGPATDQRAGGQAGHAPVSVQLASVWVVTGAPHLSPTFMLSGFAEGASSPAKLLVSQCSFAFGGLWYLIKK